MKTAIALFCFAAPIAFAAETVSEVPEQFLGEWNSVITDCGTGYNDSRLRIERSYIRFYESDGPIRAIVAHGKYEMALIAELSGEGDTWVTTKHFKLSADGRSISDTTGAGEPFVRYRCPPQEEGS